MDGRPEGGVYTSPRNAGPPCGCGGGGGDCAGDLGRPFAVKPLPAVVKPPWRPAFTRPPGRSEPATSELWGASLLGMQFPLVPAGAVAPGAAAQRVFERCLIEAAAAPTDGPSTAMAVGPTHEFFLRPDGTLSACALGADGVVQCWGDTTLTDGAPGTDRLFSEIACGYGHACGVQTDGEIYCWGYDRYGETVPPN